MVFSFIFLIIGFFLL
ncbi:MAG: hypothetical protein P8048_04645, partial [Calditrichia bacterium]